MNEPTSPPAAVPPPPPPPPAVFPVPVTLAAPAARQLKSPGLSGFLSILPGAGHLYLGLYQRGIKFFAVWLGLIVIGERIPAPFGFFTVTFWMVFVLLDAVRHAKAINTAGAPESNLAIEDTLPDIGGSLGLGVFLLLVGAFFLVDKFVTIDLTFLENWWPLLLVAFGAWQVLTYMKAKKDAEETQSRTGTIDA